MAGRRVVEIAVAALVFVLLLTVFLVRSTSRREAAPPIALFRQVEGAPPDFTSDSYRTVRAVSPDGSRTAILYPAEFETPADLYIVGPGDTGTRFTLVDSLRAENNPKWVGWLGNQALAVTVGHLYGTVSPGGDLFLVDPRTGRAAVLWVSPDSGRSQAVAARLGDRGSVLVQLSVFGDNMMNPQDSTLALPPTVFERARASLGLDRPVAARPRAAPVDGVRAAVVACAVPHWGVAQW